jgi:hypothetical protein
MLSEEALEPLLGPVPNNREKFRLMKDDDAEVPYHLWDNRLCDLLHRPRGQTKLIAILDCMRRQLLVQWKGNVTRSFWSWLRLQPAHVKRHPNTRI